MRTRKRKPKATIPDRLFDALLERAHDFGFSSTDISRAAEDPDVLNRMAALVGGVWARYPVDINPTYTLADLLAATQLLNDGLPPALAARVFRADTKKEERTVQLSLVRQRECKLHGLYRHVARMHLQPATMSEFLFFLLAHRHELNDHPLYTFGRPLDALIKEVEGAEPTQVILIAYKRRPDQYILSTRRVRGLAEIQFPGNGYRDRHTGCLVAAPLE